jgi:hypothetical protein
VNYDSYGISSYGVGRACCGACGGYLSKGLKKVKIENQKVKGE